MTWRPIIGLALGLCVSGPAYSADEDGRYIVGGPGRTSCQTLTAVNNVEDPRLTMMAAWTSGYIGAHNKLMDDTYELMSWQTIEMVMQQLRRFCASNPDRQLVDAANQYIAYLEQNRLTKAQDRLSVSNGTQTAVVYADTLDRIRKALEDRGYDGGEAGSDSLPGLAAFQAAEGLPASGLPDQRTLQKLFAKR